MGVGDALHQLEEDRVLLLKVVEELLGDLGDVERLADAARHFDDRGVAFGVELAQIEHQRVELANEQVPRLTVEVIVCAGVIAAVLAEDPRPDALASGAVDEDEHMLVVVAAG